MRWLLICLGSIILCCSSAHAEPNDYCKAKTEISILHSANPTGVNGACISYRIKELRPRGIWFDLGVVGDTYRKNTRTYSRHGLLVGISGSINGRARFGIGFGPTEDIILYARVAVIK